jgi:hypothetical protein
MFIHLPTQTKTHKTIIFFHKFVTVFGHEKILLFPLPWRPAANSAEAEGIKGEGFMKVSARLSRGMLYQ